MGSEKDGKEGHLTQNDGCCIGEKGREWQGRAGVIQDS